MPSPLEQQLREAYDAYERAVVGGVEQLQSGNPSGSLYHESYVNLRQKIISTLAELRCDFRPFAIDLVGRAIPLQLTHMHIDCFSHKSGHIRFLTEAEKVLRSFLGELPRIDEDNIILEQETVLFAFTQLANDLGIKESSEFQRSYTVTHESYVYCFVLLLKRLLEYREVTNDLLSRPPCLLDEGFRDTVVDNLFAQVSLSGLTGSEEKQFVRLFVTAASAIKLDELDQWADIFSWIYAQTGDSSKEALRELLWVKTKDYNLTINANHGGMETGEDIIDGEDDELAAIIEYSGDLARQQWQTCVDEMSKCFNLEQKRTLACLDSPTPRASDRRLVTSKVTFLGGLSTRHSAFGPVLRGSDKSSRTPESGGVDPDSQPGSFEPVLRESDKSSRTPESGVDPDSQPGSFGYS